MMRPKLLVGKVYVPSDHKWLSLPSIVHHPRWEHSNGWLVEPARTVLRWGGVSVMIEWG